VGKKGVIEFEYFRPSRRFCFGGCDNMQKLLNQKCMDFLPKQTKIFDEDEPPF
jgi:hypothetical protein